MNEFERLIAVKNRGDGGANQRFWNGRAEIAVWDGKRFYSEKIGIDRNINFTIQNNIQINDHRLGYGKLPLLPQFILRNQSTVQLDHKIERLTRGI